MSIVTFEPIRRMDILCKDTLEVLRLRYRGLAGVPRDLLDVLLLKLHGEQDLDRSAHIVHQDFKVLLG
jgi:hypothetical protein